MATIVSESSDVRGVRKFAAYSGARTAPLLIGLHGFRQAASGSGDASYWSFLEHSELHEVAPEWSIYAPQAAGKNWRARHHGIGLDLVTEARAVTDSDGPVILAGFSDGATCCHHLVTDIQPQGLLAVSGFFTALPALQSITRVAIVCGDEDFRRIVRESDAAARYYESRGHLVREWGYPRRGRGIQGRHYWPAGLNRELLAFLGSDDE